MYRMMLKLEDLFDDEPVVVGMIYTASLLVLWAS
jgi:hypothetical protein